MVSKAEGTKPETTEDCRPLITEYRRLYPRWARTDENAIMFAWEKLAAPSLSQRVTELERERDKAHEVIRKVIDADRRASSDSDDFIDSDDYDAIITEAKLLIGWVAPNTTTSSTPTEK